MEGGRLRAAGICAFALLSLMVPGTVQAKSYTLDEFIRLVLNKNYDLSVTQEQVKVNEYQIDMQNGAFAWTATLGAQQKRTNPLRVNGVDTTALKREQSYSLSFERPTQSGIKLTASAQSAIDLAIANADNTLSGASVQLDVPLMRGLGYEVNRAGIESAQASYQGSVLDFSHSASNTVKQALILYWQYLGLAETIKSYEASLERKRMFQKIIHKLVDVGEKPASDTAQVDAEIAVIQQQILASRLSQEQFKASMQLIAGLPYDPDFSLDSIPFPVFSGNLQPDVVATWKAFAMNHRADVHAAEKNIDASRSSLLALEDKLKPDVTLSLAGSVKASNLSGGERWPGAYQTHGSRPDYSVGITYTNTFGKQTDKATVGAQQARVESLRWQREKLHLTVASELNLLREQLVSATEQEKKSHVVVELNARALEDEEKKYQLGMSTVLDRLVIEEKLTQADLSLANKKVDLARFITELNFSLGRLLSEQGDVYRILSPTELGNVPVRGISVRQEE